MGIEMTLSTQEQSLSSPGERMLIISSPLAEAPWYLEASGSLTVDSITHLRAAIQAAQHGELDIPVLDITKVQSIEPAAGDALASMVLAGEISLLGANSMQPPMPIRLAAVFRESRLEATEAIFALIRQRRHDGIADTEAVSRLLDHLRASLAQ
jgi:hypothetical protein